MPRIVMSDRQVATVLAVAAIGEPSPHSPLLIPAAAEPLPADDPGVEELRARGVLQPGRVNGLFLQYLAAALDPDEAIHLAVGHDDYPGLSVVRKGQFWTECTVAADGSTAFDFPVTREAVVASLLGSLSHGRANHPEPGPDRFVFVGRPDDAFVLSTAVRLQGDAESLQLERLAAKVVSTATKPEYSAGLTLVGGHGRFERLATERDAFDASLGRLITGGHLQTSGSDVRVPQTTLDALGENPIGTFALARLTRTDGRMKRRGIQVMRLPSRTLVYRTRRTSGEPLVEWREVSLPQLRAIVLAVCVGARAQQELATAVEAGARDQM